MGRDDGERRALSRCGELKVNTCSRHKDERGPVLSDFLLPVVLPDALLGSEGPQWIFSCHCEGLESRTVKYVLFFVNCNKKVIGYFSLEDCVHCQGFCLLCHFCLTCSSTAP